MRMDVSKFLGVLDVLFSHNSTHHGVSCNIFPSVTKWLWPSLKATPVHSTWENKFLTLGQPWTQSPKLTDRVYPAGCRRQVLCVTLATWEPRKAELAYPHLQTDRLAHHSSLEEDRQKGVLLTELERAGESASPCAHAEPQIPLNNAQSSERHLCKLWVVLPKEMFGTQCFFFLLGPKQALVLRTQEVLYPLCLSMGKRGVASTHAHSLLCGTQRRPTEAHSQQWHQRQCTLNGFIWGLLEVGFSR